MTAKDGPEVTGGGAAPRADAQSLAELAEETEKTAVFARFLDIP